LTYIGNLYVGDKAHTRVMGIINVSPESFYKSSIKIGSENVAKAAQSMQRMGANLIDVGAMSTAPYIQNLIPAEEEARRITEAIKIVKNSCDLPVSADTPRSKVAEEAINAGADAVNDITGLKYDTNMAKVLSKLKVPVIVGAYNSGRLTGTSGKLSTIMKLLSESIRIAREAKIQDDNIIVDPSIGFFRREGLNPFFTKMTDIPWYRRDIEIILKLTNLKTLYKPICISVSRKSFMGHLLNLKTKDRLIPSIVAELVSLNKGANIVRTHDVKESVQAIIMADILDW
jgi:dihydropteroate synthase